MAATIVELKTAADGYMANIEQRRQAREYDDYAREKVEAARRQRDAGLHFSNEEVEAEAATRRVELLRRIGGEAGL